MFSVLWRHPWHFLLCHMWFYPNISLTPTGLEDTHPPPTYILLMGISNFKRNMKLLISSYKFKSPYTLAYMLIFDDIILGQSYCF